MNKIILFTLMSLSIVSTAEDLCVNAYRTVCPNNVEASRDDVRAIEARVEKVASKLLTKKRLQALKQAKDPSEPKFAEDYVKYINLVYSEVLTTLETAGFKEADTVTHISRIRDRIANQVRNGALPFETESGRYSNEKLAQYVASIKLVSPKNISEIRKKPELRYAIKSFISLCSFNGLKRNAYFNSRQGEFLVCPGMYVDVMSLGSVHALDAVIAHELGHSVDASSLPFVGSELPEEWPLLKRYQPFMQCLERNFSGELTTIRSQIERMENMGDERTPEITKLLERTRQMEEWYTSFVGHSPLASESNAKELIADTFSNMTVAEILSEMPERERPAAFSAAFGALCSSRDPGMPRDGQHPHADFRLNRAMSYSGMRRALGCRTVETERAWCSLRGDNH